MSRLGDRSCGPRPRNTQCPPAPPRKVHTIRLDLGHRLDICVINVYSNGEFEVSGPLDQLLEEIEIECHNKDVALKKK